MFIKQLRSSLKFSFIITITIILTFGLSLSLQSVLATWTAPAENPPNEDIDPLVHNEAANPAINIVLGSSLGIQGNLTMGGNIALGSYWLSGDGGNEGISVNSDGNVGIGTTIPGAKLDIVTGNAVGINWKFNTSYGNSSISNIFDSGSDVGNKMNFNVNNAAGIATTRITILGNGNVGIGTTNPQTKLQIFDITNDLAAFTFTENSTSGYTTKFNMDDTGLDIGHNSASRSLNFITGGLDRLTILGNGNVGIGLADPSSKLEVNGQITGGFGSYTTAGVADWNDTTNARSGNGYSLLLGTALNGPGVGGYYHPFSFEYNTKDGTGNLTQMAIPYNSTAINSGIYMRTRYSYVWTSWTRIISENIYGNVGIGDTTPDADLKLDVNGKIGATEYCDQNGANCKAITAVSSEYIIKQGTGTPNSICSLIAKKSVIWAYTEASNSQVFSYGFDSYSGHPKIVWCK